MKNVIAVVILSGVLAWPAIAAAQSTPRIDRRQENQDKRIDKGVASGQLSEKEAARLEKGQAQVQKMEEKALKDGKVTRREKRRIERSQDQQSKRIKRETHDSQKER